ncbi:hypothetical protein OAA99_01720 [Omnitrophica bacterium]|jgi:hypothetical protein|nr:hypothetical protein [Candidatus Omnitrophota bacterium]
MSDVSDNLVYPTTEWDEIWNKLPNDLKIIVSKELVSLTKKDKIKFMRNLINESNKELAKLGLN